MKRFHPIGIPGQPWTAADKAKWFAAQVHHRSYREQVLSRLEPLSHLEPLSRLEPLSHLESLRERFDVRQYGALVIDPVRYPLFAALPRAPKPGLPWALVTGGVHGYETSGVQGALLFLAEHAADYADRVNLLVAPCVSPWAYEVIQRWNAAAIDPNRSFVPNSPCGESAALMALVKGMGVTFRMHIDLHETTDTDESEFRPAKAARDGDTFSPGEIPDGFYTVGDTENPQPEFQAAIIASVAEVTHIAPADENGQIIGEPVTQPGVINYAVRELGLCTSLTGAEFTSTTEVYPDSPKVTADDCNRAQVAAVRGALDFVLAR